MKRKTKDYSEPRKNQKLRNRERVPVDWNLLAFAEALKPW